MFVEAAQAFWSVMIPAHCIEETGEGHHVSDEAREYHGKERDHKYCDPEITKIILRRIESRHSLDTGEISHITDIGKPARVFRRISRY